jgi:hypothetical protein
MTSTDLWLRTWQERSFEGTLLYLKPTDLSLGRLAHLIEGSKDGAIARMGRFTTLLLSAQEEGRDSMLEILLAIFSRASGQDGRRMKSFALESKIIKGLFTKVDGDAYRNSEFCLLFNTERANTTCLPALDRTVDTLKSDDLGDVELGQVYVHKFVEKLEKDKKGKKLASVSYFTHRMFVF